MRPRQTWLAWHACLHFVVRSGLWHRAGLLALPVPGSALPHQACFLPMRPHPSAHRSSQSGAARCRQVVCSQMQALHCMLPVAAAGEPWEAASASGSTQGAAASAATTAAAEACTPFLLTPADSLVGACAPPGCVGAADMAAAAKRAARSSECVGWAAAGLLPDGHAALWGLRTSQVCGCAVVIMSVRDGMSRPPSS